MKEIKVGFFNTVEGRGLYTAADRYFEIPTLSCALGHRKFQRLPGSQALKEEVQQGTVGIGAMLLTALKVISYFTAILPLLALLIKAIGRATLHAKLPVDPVPQKIAAADAKEFWNEVFSFTESASFFLGAEFAEAFLKEGHIHEYRQDTTQPFCSHLVKQGVDSIPGCFDPDRIDEGYASTKPNAGYEKTQLNLISRINHAFSAGYKVWTVQVNWNGHVRSLSIFQNGQVRLIDSKKKNNQLELDLILARLNQSGLTGIDGKPLVFNGAAIGTGLQKDSVHCSRLAALYSYAMALTGEVDGWQRVHGALLNGTLKSIDDLDCIKDAPKIADLGSHNRSLYWDFMRSIFYRAFVKD